MRNRAHSPRGLRHLLGLLVLALALAPLVPGPAAAEQAASATHRVAAASIDAGHLHTCVILGTGRVRCWGGNTFGGLGLGHTEPVGDDEAPASAPLVDLGAGRTARAIAVGTFHSCAILDTGQVRCWGRNNAGQLGLGPAYLANHIGDNEHPADVPVVDLGPGRTARAITAGASHSCVILDTGQVRCWGQNDAGQLGLAHTEPIGDDEHPSSAPVVQLGAGRSATAIASGGHHTCAILDTGQVRCWGYNLAGQLGLGHIQDIGDNEHPGSVPVLQLGAGRTARALSAHENHSCAVLDNGSVRCWGVNGHGQLGLGNVEGVGHDSHPSSQPVVQLGPGRTARTVSTGYQHTCAVLDDGQVRCWGRNDHGELGLGHVDTVGDNEHPASVPTVQVGAGRTARALATGQDFACAVLDDGGVRCWGLNDLGQLGRGDTVVIGDNEHPSTSPLIGLGGGARTSSVTSLAVKPKKKRDRKAPYRFVLRGPVTGAFIADAATCTGTVKVVVRKATKPKRNKRVGKATKPLRLNDGRCFVKVKVRTKKKLPGKLKAVVRYRGSTNLAPATTKRTLRAG